MDTNQKIAEWVGFYTTELFGPSYWWRPDGYSHGSHLPDFAHSLDDLFEWVVPKLEFCELVKHDRPDRKGWFATVRAKEKTRFINHKEPALALCYAVEKLIDA